GDVWSFTIPSKKAYEPIPSDGRKFIDPDNLTLTWTPGFEALMHTVYFGDDYDTVANATDGGQQQIPATFSPGPLETEKTYYWRVDELNKAQITHTGEVWSFNTMPDIPITDPNLVGWWKFETGAGNEVIDFSGHGNHGTIVDKVHWVPGQFNLALEFFGDNQGHVELPARIVTTASGSVAMWVNTNQTGDLYSEGTFWYGTEEAGMGFGDQEIHIHSQTSGALGFWMGGATDVSLGGPMLAGTGWNHVAVTWDQTDGCRLYFNGVQADFQAHNGKVADLAVIRLGRPNRNFRFLKGFLDDVRLFDHAITTEQINEIMTKGEDPLKAGGPSPGNGSVATLTVAKMLTWSAGEGASQHDVYFGTDYDAVANATADSPEFQGNQTQTSLSVAGMVEFGGGDYYWRVDEIAADGTVIAGTIWKFTVPDYLIVDDFEEYDVGNNEIWWSWKDGLGFAAHDNEPAYPGNGTGSAVGDETTASYTEETIVHDGGKSMPFAYDNNKQGFANYSEVELTLVAQRDWTEEGVAELSIWFRGDPSNAPEPMYIAIANSAGTPAMVVHNDPAAAQINTWAEWIIPLQTFADQGVALTDIDRIAIGLGIQGNMTIPGGSGKMYFDDIRLYQPREVAE
ncbi:MAG: LamG domain-containing protein, partial [Sedimentisphaerales bacterium]